MSPTSTSDRAAPEGPIPLRSRSLVPVATTTSGSSLSAATRRLVLPAASLGRTLASSAMAWAAVDQNPQDRELLVVDHRPKPAHPGSDQGNGVGVGGVGLAALPGHEHPSTCRQLGRDVDNFLAVGREPVGDVLAEAGTALDRPDPPRPPLRVAQHRGAAAPSVPNRPPPRIASSVAITSIVADHLCGSIPITTRSGPPMPLRSS